MFFSCRWLLCLIVENSFFRVHCFFIFLVATIHSSKDTVFSRWELAATNCLYTMYLTNISIKCILLFQRSTCIWGSLLQWPSIFKGAVFLSNKNVQPFLFSKVLSYFAIPVAAIHSMNRKIKEQMQPRILSNVLCFWRTVNVARKYHSY